MKFQQADTINILTHRDEFPRIESNNQKKHTLQYIHCCLNILIQNNSNTIYNNPLLDQVFLVIDMDKLEANYSEISKVSTNKSLDFAFVVLIDDSKFMVLGDFKLNKTNLTNPYKGLADKYNGSITHAEKFNIPLHESIIIVCSDKHIEEIRRNANNRRIADDDSDKLKYFEFMSLTSFLNYFFN